MTGQNRYISVHIGDCEKNRIFLMVPIKSVCNLPGVVLFNEDGKLMTQQSATSMKKAYVLLAIVKKLQAAEQFGISVTKNEVEICNKFWYNQIKTDGSFILARQEKFLVSALDQNFILLTIQICQLLNFRRRKENMQLL